MLTAWKQQRPEGCISDLEFDEWRALELEPGAVQALTQHLEGCSRCRGRHALLEAQANAFLERFPKLELPGAISTSSGPGRVQSIRAGAANSHAPVSGKAWRRAWTLASGLAGLAAAALAFLLLRPVEPVATGETGTRIKGSARFGFFVKRGDRVWSGGDGEVVHPGDQLRFTLTTVRPSHTAILSLDGAGVASVYHPSGTRSQHLGVVRDRALDQSIELDGALGPERLWAVFCDQPFELEPLRAQLETDRELDAPPGCTLDRLSLTKRSSP